MAVCGLAARIGRKAYPVRSWEQVSTAYVRAIEHAGLGASQVPSCEIINLLGNVVAHVSYNGKIWPGRQWREDAKPLYEPL